MKHIIIFLFYLCIILSINVTEITSYNNVTKCNKKLIETIKERNILQERMREYTKKMQTQSKKHIAPKYGQCGGKKGNCESLGFECKDDKVIDCKHGYTCQRQNEFFWQCLKKQSKKENEDEINV